MCGRAREHRNRDRFGFYDGVERCARTGNDAIYTFAERSVFKSAHVVGALRSLGVAKPLYSHFLLYRFIVFHCLSSLSHFFSFSLFLSSRRSLWADFEFIAPKRRLRAMYYSSVSLCCDFITRHARPAATYPRMRAYAAVTHVAASVDF